MAQHGQSSFDPHKVETLSKQLDGVGKQLDDMAERLDRLEKDKLGNRYLKGFPENGKVLRPSAAYKEACSSYSYRISELVFGSLLAAYILGSINFATQAKSGWEFINYLFISVTFAFLTAAFYTTYHKSILTMPNVRFEDLTNDFAIALLQAITFAISMKYPPYFLLCVGGLLALVFFRQNIKSHKLGEFFYERLDLKRGDREVGTITRWWEVNLAKEDYWGGSLEGWGPVSRGHRGAVIILLFVGLFVAALDLSSASDWVMWITTKIDPHLGIIIEDVAGAGVLIVTYRILKTKAVVVDQQGRPITEHMDVAAEKLTESLKASANS